MTKLSERKGISHKRHKKTQRGVYCYFVHFVLGRVHLVAIQLFGISRRLSRTALATVSTESSFMQRKSMGHSRR